MRWLDALRTLLFGSAPRDVPPLPSLPPVPPLPDAPGAEDGEREAVHRWQHQIMNRATPAIYRESERKRAAESIHHERTFWQRHGPPRPTEETHGG